jgi:hypothetical protein
MYKVAVNATIPILERVDVDTTNCECRGGDRRIDGLPCTAIEGNQAINERRQSLVTRADMIGQRHARVAIVLTNKPSLVSQPEFDETRIANNHALESQEFVDV